LRRIDTNNTQGEEYLTDVIAILVADGYAVGAMTAPDPSETKGVNDRVELADARRLLRDRLLRRWMQDGVTVVDPATTWVDVDVQLAQDVVLHPATQLFGSTRVATRAEIGPECSVRDTVVGEAAKIVRAHCEGAEIGAEATIGPYAYLRPGTRIGRGAKVGTYVEVKNSDVGDGAKVPHLTYVGDAAIGEGTNVGDDVRIGSDTMLVAPVTIGDGAYTAAGSVITDDVPPGAMAVARARQRNIEGWVERRRPNTPAAKAAARARHAADPAREHDDGQSEGEQSSP
jgi:bifunctional UDP-N-acetylglucosamine pyrophosphorylase/glucosamine-1-phosphate N-acetyltransferase